MSRDARRKEKQRLKRKQKQLAARKAAAVTPLDRLVKGAGHLECWVNDDWPENGMASIQVLGVAPDGRCAHAGFLIDVWCVGLKDAFGRRTASRADFEEQLDRAAQGLNVVRMPPAEAKRLVTGAIRFSRQNGFHLPPHYDRWAAIFGDLGDLAHADLTDFGTDTGKLRYVGDEQFLRKRLAACSVEQFMARPDVEFVMGGRMPFEFEDLDEKDLVEGDEAPAPGEGLDLSDRPLLAALDNILGSVGDRAEDAVRQWCLRNGQAPHPRLRDAVDALLISAMPTAVHEQVTEEEQASVDARNEAGEADRPPDPQALLDSGLGSLPAAERRSVQEAMQQVAAFMQQFPSPQAMIESMMPVDFAD